jgi:nitrate reductase NapE component
MDDEIINLPLEIESQLEHNPLVISKVNLQSQDDANLERNLRELKARQELRKDWLIFIFKYILGFLSAILVITLLGCYGFLILFRDNISLEEKKIATSIFSLIATGLLSFITGRATATPK